MLCMTPSAFRTLVYMFKERNLPKNTKFSWVEEQVASFLYILADHVSNDEANFFWCWSRETINHHFYKVLRAIISPEDLFFVQPSDFTMPEEILDNEEWFYPYFQVVLSILRT